MNPVVHTYYLPVDGVELYTIVALPNTDGKFPTVIVRSPYEEYHKTMSDEEIKDYILKNYSNWLENGYVFLIQDCRGTGKSTGDSNPFVYERVEGLALLEWVRKQPFYNEEIYLLGGSYCGTVHFATSPFASDIKGAVFEATDCEYYNFLYLNGFFRANLHGGWFIDRYKNKSDIKKDFTPEKFKTLPMTEYTRSVFGEPIENLDEIYMHPKRNDPFWDTPYGGSEMRGAVKNADIPMLFITGFYDIFSNGGFDMWNSLDDETKAKSAFIIHPYHHGGTSENQPYHFNGGETTDLTGDFEVKWMDYVRGKGPSPVPTGKITYYELFDNAWHTDDFTPPKNSKTFTLGEGEMTYTYDPADPAVFRGGLTHNFGGTVFEDEAGSRADILNFYTEPFSEDLHIKGKMTAKLRVRSDCEDTSFYIRVCLVKKEGDFVLRDDINQISNFCENYVPGTDIDMEFTFDNHAFMIHAGERLRIEVSSSAFPLFIPHTNNKGLYTVQTSCKVAQNTVICDKSSLTILYE